jgi:hypothetical protein
MEIEKHHKRKIHDIITSMDCKKDFKCYKSQFEDICKVKDSGVTGYVDCLGKDPQACEFSMPFGESILCRCPLRVYVAKNMNI